MYKDFLQKINSEETDFYDIKKTLEPILNTKFDTIRSEIANNFFNKLKIEDYLDKENLEKSLSDFIQNMDDILNLSKEE